MDVSFKVNDFHLVYILCALSLASFDETSCHVVNFPMKSHTWQETEGYLQPASSKEFKPLVQFPMRNRIQPIRVRVEV